jgi:uncharacterized protein YvpB
MHMKRFFLVLLLIGILDFIGYKTIQVLNTPIKKSFALSPITSQTISQNITPPQFEKLNIPLITQTKNLSCESAAIKMVLEKFKQYPTEDEIQSKFIYNKNPYKGFRGNVNGAPLGFTDYGAYAEPVAQVFAQFGIPTEIHYAINEQYLKEIVQKGKPVIIWVNRTEKSPRIKYEIIDGQKVKLISGEHVVVVEGYQNGKWLINDPWSKSINGKKIAEQVEVTDLNSVHWDQFDYMAISIN